jgi:hypothetical protein
MPLQHVAATAFADAVLRESSHHTEFERSHPLSMP